MGIDDTKGKSEPRQPTVNEVEALSEMADQGESLAELAAFAERIGIPVSFIQKQTQSAMQDLIMNALMAARRRSGSSMGLPKGPSRKEAKSRGLTRIPERVQEPVFGTLGDDMFGAFRVTLDTWLQELRRMRDAETDPDRRTMHIPTAEEILQLKNLQAINGLHAEDSGTYVDSKKRPKEAFSDHIFFATTHQPPVMIRLRWQKEFRPTVSKRAQGNEGNCRGELEISEIHSGHSLAKIILSPRYSQKVTPDEARSSRFFEDSQGQYSFLASSLAARVLHNGGQTPSVSASGYVDPLKDLDWSFSLSRMENADPLATVWDEITWAQELADFAEHDMVRLINEPADELPSSKKEWQKLSQSAPFFAAGIRGRSRRGN